MARGKCPICGRTGSGPHVKWAKERKYRYLYFAHRNGSDTEWCYIGKKEDLGWRRQWNGSLAQLRNSLAKRSSLVIGLVLISSLLVGLPAIHALLTYSPPPLPKEPTASFSVYPSQYSAYVNETLTFNASPSSDIVEYQWSFGDGTTAAGKSVTHVYTGSGTYNVALTVTNEEGLSDTSSKRVSVLSMPTISVCSSVKEVSVGAKFSVDIIIADAVDLYGYAFKLQYDPEILKATDHAIIDSSDFFWGHATIEEGLTWVEEVNSQEGYAYFVVTLPLTTEGGVQGSGRVVTIEFQAISCGESVLGLYDVELNDSSANMIPCEAYDGNIIVLQP